MEEFKIEKGIEIPKGPIVRKRRYPFLKMEIGDSIFIEGKTVSSISGSRNWAKHRHKIETVCRAENGGVRVWRVE